MAAGFASGSFVSDFIEQCRREWGRLGVPDQLAGEMATELAADLGEAEAEGVAAGELLGNSVSDPRSFAASWAAERGIIPASPSRLHLRRRPRTLVAFTALAALAMIVAAVLLLTGEPKLSLDKTGQPHIPAAAATHVSPGPGPHVLPPVSAAAPIEWLLLLGAIVVLGFAGWLWAGWGRSRPPGAPA
jgi:hypothetical protein